MPLSVPARTYVLVVASCTALNCGRPIIANRPASDAPPRAPLTQLWNEPHDLERRDLRWGAASADLAHDFEDTRLIRDIRGADVPLDYRGSAAEMLDTMSVADVIWACTLMNRLQDAQLDDAFEAAGYEPAIRSRYIRTIRATLQEGLAFRADARFSTEGGRE